MAWGKTQNLVGPAGATGIAGPQGPAGPIVPATQTVIGAVKPGVGLTVQADGTLDSTAAAGACVEVKLATKPYQASRWDDFQGIKCIYSPSVTQFANINVYDPAYSDGGGWTKLDSKAIYTPVVYQSLAPLLPDANPPSGSPATGGNYGIHGLTFVPSMQKMQKTDLNVWKQIGGAGSDWEVRLYGSSPNVYSTEWQQMAREDVASRPFGQPACENLIGEYMFNLYDDDNAATVSRINQSSACKHSDHWFANASWSNWMMWIVVKIGTSDSLTWDEYFAYRTSGEFQYRNLSFGVEWNFFVHMMPAGNYNTPT